jgi:chromate transporter
MSEPATTDIPPAPRSVPELFIVFAKMSLSGFGGVLPWAHRALVEEKRWLDAREFNELLALSQFLPGPNIVNFSVVFGSRLFGVPGALAALFGLIGPPLVLVIAVAALYAVYGDIPQLRAALAAVAAVAAGMIIATVSKLARPIFHSIGFAPAVAVICFVTIGVLRWPLPYVLLVVAPLSCLIAYARHK